MYICPLLTWLFVFWKFGHFHQNKGIPDSNIFQVCGDQRLEWPRDNILIRRKGCLIDLKDAPARKSAESHCNPTLVSIFTQRGIRVPWDTVWLWITVRFLLTLVSPITLTRIITTMTPSFAPAIPQMRGFVMVFSKPCPLCSHFAGKPFKIRDTETQRFHWRV